MRATANKSTTAFIPSFRSGFASVACPWKSSSACRRAIAQRMDKGLAGDWQAIGDDFRTAIMKYKAGASWKNK